MKRNNWLFTATAVLAISNIAHSSAAEVEEILVTGVKDTTVVHTSDTLVSTPDTASLLKLLPGANINKNGELTGIAQYRGMYGDRINININGVPISSGGPNAMDAPLHYMPVALLETLTVQRGIAPVSKGQETIGGHMEATPHRGEFGGSESFESHARLYSGLQSVNQGMVVNLMGTVANQDHLFRAAYLQEQGDDSEFPGGKILPSEFDRERFDLGYSYQGEIHDLSIDTVINNTGNTGTPALPMDIRSVDSMHLNGHWQAEFDSIVLNASAGFNDIEHWMTNYHLRQAPTDAMRYRQTFAESKNSNVYLAAEKFVDNGLWRLGLDGHFSGHDATVTNPNAAMFNIENFNGVSRDIVGVFVEREMQASATMSLAAGLRLNQVSMDADTVSANLNPMNMMMGMPVMMNSLAGNLADRFNNSQRKQQDVNHDWFVRSDFEYSESTTLYVGLARKSRSPSYQERYLWLPMESTGGLADGKVYIGDVELDPEVSHEIELGFDYLGTSFEVFPRVFYKRVHDYIQGTPVSMDPASQFAMMMANMGMGDGMPLQFSNVDAALYGLDLESSYVLSPALQLRGNLSIVRAERKDIDDHLYRIMPDNLLLALDYNTGNWIFSLENITYARQHRVSVTNAEQETGGYALFNLVSRYYLDNDIELGIGINNLFDRGHKEHLSGYNRAVNPDIAMRERLPGYGRNLYARLIWNF